MPEKNISTWFAVWDSLPEPMRAALVATAVAMVRVMYDDREPRIVRRVLESVLCGAIALGVAELAEAVGLPSGYATFAGGAIGLLGADQVREWAKRVAQKRVDDVAGK